MKLERKIYTTRNEKIIDFVIGFIGWFVLNTVFWVLLTFGMTGLFALVGSVPSSNSNLGDAVAIVGALLNCLPFFLNILVLIFFVFTRYWIALGILGAFGASLLIALCATVVFAAICFSALGGGQ